VSEQEMALPVAYASGPLRIYRLRP
jgi:hypothetical protein